jgi:hypothetical protein
MSGVYLRADPEDMIILDGRDDQKTRRADRGTTETLEIDQDRLRLANIFFMILTVGRPVFLSGSGSQR